MPEKYLPRKLPWNRDYPGYQFYCTLQMKGAGAQQCFCFAVLSVIDWLKSRLRETDVIPDEIAGLPERGKSAEISPSALQSFTVSSGFSAYAVSLPEHGIWSLRLKEPDADVKNKRKAFPGRFFATNAGLRILDDTRVELGIRIDVTEPMRRLSASSRACSGTGSCLRSAPSGWVPGATSSRKASGITCTRWPRNSSICTMLV